MSNRLAVWLVPLLPLLMTACSEAPEQALASRWPMLKQYCTDCHNDDYRITRLLWSLASLFICCHCVGNCRDGKILLQCASPPKWS